jgi:hypothetical protein
VEVYTSEEQTMGPVLFVCASGAQPLPQSLDTT